MAETSEAPAQIIAPHQYQMVEVKLPVLKKTVQIIKLRRANENREDKGQ